jgi:hypothetical protein
MLKAYDTFDNANLHRAQGRDWRSDVGASQRLTTERPAREVTNPRSVDDAVAICRDRSATSSSLRAR